MTGRPRRPRRGNSGMLKPVYASHRGPQLESKLINSRGGSRQWTAIVADVVKHQPICWLQLPGICTGRSQTADHYWPRSTHPELIETRSNLRGACNACNRTRGNIQPQFIEQLKADCARKIGRRIEATGAKPSALRIFD